MSTVHLIHGYLGVGKTTFAKQPERDTGGLRTTIDDHLLGISHDPVTLDPDLLASVWELLNDLWPRVVVAGVQDVILDFSFWSRAGRERARAQAAEIGADVRLYDVRCSDAEALARCVARSTSGEPCYHFDEAAFRDLRVEFEPTTEDEAPIVIDTTPN